MYLAFHLKQNTTLRKPWCKLKAMFSIRSITSPLKVLSKCCYWQSNYVYIQLITNSCETYKGEILNSNTRFTTNIKLQFHHV